MYTHTPLLTHAHSLTGHQTHTRSIIRWLPWRGSEGARCCTTPPWWFCILMVPLLFSLHPFFPSAGNSGMLRANIRAASVCLTTGRPNDTITVQRFPTYITYTAFECDVQGWRRGGVGGTEVAREHTVGGSRLSLHQNKQRGTTEDKGWPVKGTNISINTFLYYHCRDFHRPNVLTGPLHN